MLKNVWKFIKNPVYKTYKDATPAYKARIFFSLLSLNLFFGIGIVVLNEGLITLLELDMGDHASESLMDSYSPLIIFFLIVIAAPLLEELFFRGPLIFFKHHPHFRFYFYASAILFGFVHFFNFEFSLPALLMAPLLVAPQLIMGFFLGYIRVKLGLRWSILLHASHNGILMIPLLLTKVMDIPAV
ncbi:CPBP family intramembrane glutamic endopeptidase [Spongiimicrobium salis]|uniref:CPBP family intramembrane glutamic endopeptidase n=1 Tax=Spongiimicrobium salis TaxID=1667022 RepID=UPI00374D7167